MTKLGNADRRRAEGGDRHRGVGGSRRAAAEEGRAAADAFGRGLDARRRTRSADAAVAAAGATCAGRFAEALVLDDLLAGSVLRRAGVEARALLEARRRGDRRRGSFDRRAFGCDRRGGGGGRLAGPVRVVEAVRGLRGRPARRRRRRCRWSRPGAGRGGGRRWGWPPAAGSLRWCRVPRRPNRRPGPSPERSWPEQWSVQACFSSQSAPPQQARPSYPLRGGSATDCGTPQQGLNHGLRRHGVREDFRLLGCAR